VLVVVGNTVSWEDSWLDGGLAWLVGPLAFESVSLWWLWGSFLSAASGEISGADWLAVGGDPLIAGWKLRKILDVSDGLNLNIVSDWPWAVVSSNLSAISTCSLSVSVHASAFWKFRSACCKLFIVWCIILIFFSIFAFGLNEPISSGGESTNLSALDFSSTSIWAVHSCALWKFWEVKSI